MFAQDRLAGPRELRSTVPLAHSMARISAQYDRGPADPAFSIRYVTMLLKPSEAQQADLEQLLADQQDRSSPNYHRWLKPEEFGARFGLTDADISVLVAWLNSEGMQVHDIARGRHWITFSGAAGDIGRALRTEIHRYYVDGRDHFANATPLSIPAGFDGVVTGFLGVNDLSQPKPPLDASEVKPAPDFTSPHGHHYLAPGDFATIYDINPLLKAGIGGTGQSIAVVGVSDILSEDISSFRSQFNLPVNDPHVILYGIDPGMNGAMIEADLDLEWSGAVAPNATIYYVNALNAYLAALYVIDTNLAPILSMSFGYCEPAGSPADEVFAEQANAQGITWIASSGDTGAAQCDPQDAYPQASRGIAVNLPASLPEVTAIGGTQFNEGAGNYWAATNGAGVSSALSYIPEQAWNETTDGSPIGATGGGASIYFQKPLWQTGTGVPNDNARDLPDVALAASAAHDPYLVYSGATMYGIGGTSAGTPAFAGILALLTQYLTSKGIEKQAGLGNINPTLYRLAQTAPSAYHDITSGNNIVPCVEATPNCMTGSFGYSAGPGYDQVTGLGSIDVNNLVTHWRIGTPTSTSLLASPSTLGVNGGNLQLTATVTGSGSAPTGMVAFFYSQNPLGSALLVASSGNSAIATLAVDANLLLVGTHPLTVVYSGNHTFDGSAGSTNVTVTVPASGTAIAPSIANDPVLQGPPDLNGMSWQADIVLTEEAGVGATVTGLSVNGASYDSQLTSIFKTTAIPPHGTLTGNIGFASLKTPVTQTFVFTGTDAGGGSWSASTSARFVGTMEIRPGITLSVTPGTIVRNAANASCPWQQQLIIQEQGGNYVSLTSFAMGALDLTSSISTVFGTNRLAPFNSLQGNYCRSDAQASETEIFEVAGVTETGQVVKASANATYQAFPAPAATMSVSPANVMFTGSGYSGATIVVKFSSGDPSWAFSILPGAQTTSWLSVVQLGTTSGGGLSILANPYSLGKGVYNATLVIQAVDTMPQFINVPITLVVGDTSEIQIGGVSNAASSKQAFAPGMLMSVYGSSLAPAGSAQLASTIPLPLNLAGVSATVNGNTAPIYYLSPAQLNIQVPYETSAGTAILGVNNNGQVASFPFQVAAVAPGIFTDSSGSLVPNGSAKAGDTLVLFITGAGDLSPNIMTGFTPDSGTPVGDLPQTLLPVSVSVGGESAKIAFAGVPSGLVGVAQINFTVPSDVKAGKQPVVVSVGGVASQTANLTITQ